MAFWNNSEYTPIGVGTNINDGTGDVIRTAFIKVDNNFANINAQLAGVNQDWLNANVQYQFNVPGSANISNLFVSNLSGTISSFTGNSTAANVIATKGLYSYGPAYVAGNLQVTGTILPTIAGSDLGSASNPFGNLHVANVVSTNSVTNSVTAGLFEIHANIGVADVQDVGIFGNVSNDYLSGNMYAFFGHQYTTNNFIYKITPIDATKGNNIVAGGVYGNVQFGSAFLSNTTPATNTSTGALIVAGGAGIGGDVYTAGNTTVAGNIYSGGYQVLTTNTPGAGNIYSGGATFATPVIITNSTISTSTSTGALILSYGGAGIAGNVYAGGFVGPLYGTIQTNAQPYITSVGTLTQLQVSTSVGAAAVFISGSGVVGAPLIVTSGGANIGGNLLVTGIINSTAGIVTQANLTASNINTTGTTINSGINTVGNIVAANITVTQTNGNLQGTVLTAAQPNITSIGASGLTVGGNTAVNNTLYGRGIYDNNNRVLSTSSGSGNLSISGAAVTLPATGPGAITVGSATSVPVITTDAYGRFASLTSASISTTLGIAGTSGTGNVALLSQSLTVAGGTDISTTASGQTITVNSTSTLATVTGRGASTTTALTLANITVGNITPAGNVTQNIGSSSSWFNSIYGTAVHAQYADLAENYLADVEYEPGTVVIFGGEAEITTTSVFADTRVAGAISTDPAYLMNGACGGLPLALRGRIPLKLIGPVEKGDLLVTSTTPGYAVSVGNDKSYGASIFAKSLTNDLSDGEKIIEAVIL